MCLFTTQKEIKIAKKNITCYKVINQNMTSLYHTKFKWELGKLYKTEMKMDYNTPTVNSVSQAFHSYKTLQDLEYAYYSTSTPCMMVKCTIPKGSEYCSGKQTEMDGYASNQIIMEETLDVKDVFNRFDWDNYPFKVGQKIKTNKGKDIFQIMNIQPVINNQCRADLIVENCANTNPVVITTEYKKGTWGGADIELEILKD
jgi:hypothetical protein